MDSTTLEKVRRAKKLLADDTGAIELHDFVSEEIRGFLSRSLSDPSSVQSAFSNEELLKRVEAYEKLTTDLTAELITVARWARGAHRPLLQKILARSTDGLEEQGGFTVWLALKWYPALLNFYASGLAAIDGRRFDLLHDIFFAVPGSRYGSGKSFVETMGHVYLELTRSNVFTILPDAQKSRCSISDHLYNVLSPMIDAIVFTGQNYSDLFDEFEIIFSLVVADCYKAQEDHVWAPFGRFAFKSQHSLPALLGRAKERGDDWELYRQGFFGGQRSRFEQVAQEFNNLVVRVGW